MPDSLSALEARRADLLRSIADLNDMRPGSIVGAVWRCGKPNCHCARPDDPGHGPNLRLTYKRLGKTFTEALPNPAAVPQDGAGNRRVPQLPTTESRSGGGKRASLPLASR
jgi:hypothetical protein